MRDSEELLRLINGAVVAAGIDASAVYRYLGCDESLFTQAPRRVPHAYQALFWQALEAVTGDDEISLTICPHLPIFRGDALQFMLMSSPTLRDGLFEAAGYRRLISDAITLNVVEDARGSRLLLSGSASDAPEMRHTEICLVFGVLRTLRVVSRATFAPLRVRLSLTPRRPLADYQALFGCPVEFAGEHAEGLNEVWIDKDILDARSQHGSASMLTVHRGCADSQLAHVRAQDTIDHVKALLGQRIDGVAVGLDCSLDDAAAAIDVSARTLRADLASAGTSFRALKKQARMVIARGLLCGGSISIEKIAELTGFSEPTAFYRAFRSWTGQTPQAYRDGCAAQR